MESISRIFEYLAYFAEFEIFWITHNDSQLFNLVAFSLNNLYNLMLGRFSVMEELTMEI